MSEYGKEKCLTTILNDLAEYCFLVPGGTSDIKIVLPKKVLEYYSQSFKVTERSATGIPSEINNISTIRILWTHSGPINLYANEDNEVAIRELK